MPCVASEFDTAGRELKMKASRTFFKVVVVVLVLCSFVGVAQAQVAISNGTQITVLDFNEKGVDIAAHVVSGPPHWAGTPWGDVINAFDGNAGTTWAALTSGDASVDDFLSICLTNGLGDGSVSIHGLSWQNRDSANDYAKVVQAKFYSDEFNTLVGTATLSGMGAGPDVITFPPVAGVRYVRFSLLEKNVSFGNCGAREIKLTGVIPVHLPITLYNLTESGTDLAAEVYSVHSWFNNLDGYAPGKAFDNNTGTAWATQGGKASLAGGTTVEDFISLCLTNGLAGTEAESVIVNGMMWDNRDGGADLVKSLEVKFYSDEFITEVGSSGIISGLGATATNISFDAVSNVRYLRVRNLDSGVGNPGAQEIQFFGRLDLPPAGTVILVL